MNKLIEVKDLTIQELSDLLELKNVNLASHISNGGNYLKLK